MNTSSPNTKADRLLAAMDELKSPPPSEKKTFSLTILISFLSFVALYPVFFVYHSGINALGINSFLGGFYGPIAALTSILSILFLFPAKHLKKARSAWIVYTFYAYIFLAILVIVYNQLISVDYYIEQAVKQAVYGLILLYANFTIGCHMMSDDTSNESNRLKLLWLLLGLITLITCANLYMTGEAIIAPINGDNEARRVTYQGYSRSVLMTSLFILATLNKKVPILILGTLTTVLLFAIGARAEFVTFAFVFFAYFVFLDVKIWITAGILLSFLCIVTFWEEILNYLILSYPNFRVLTLLELNENSSYLLREAMNKFAIKQILENPIWGQFGGHFEFGEHAPVWYHGDYTSSGSYAHNALSVWVNYGIINFTLFIVLSVGSIITSAHGVFIKKYNSTIWKLAFLMSTSSFILVATTKAGVFFPQIGLAWGLVVCALNSSSPKAKKPIP
ncbi:O-antigen ligase family protein [Hirschia maritima]|uniref:O-antigen ligase family protein n=1 Tax=Hirschia maritima TaxID=1121961 RepID=UPI00038063D4|nr:hypothetical protein [Hirschia maritima]